MAPKVRRVRSECFPEKYQKEYASEAEMLRDVLIGMEVPEDVLLLECESQNTRENLENSLSLLPSEVIQDGRIGIVCQSFHARRAYMTAKDISFDIELLMFPANTQGITRDDWHQSEYGIQRVMGELERIGKYFAD